MTENRHKSNAERPCAMLTSAWACLSARKHAHVGGPPWAWHPDLQSPVSSLRPYSSPRGLTLIELLVTIVILVTLLAAVLPAISPNNDSRKIREASRQLTSLFAQAQAQAARDGRAVGVGFRDTWNDADNDGVVDPGELTGLALEAYIIAEPPPFTGFNTSAAVGVLDGDSNLYAPPSVDTPPALTPGDPPLVNLRFGHGVGGEGMQTDPSDWIPPQMFRGAELDDDDRDGQNEPSDNDDVWGVIGSGDIVQVGQEQFELILNDCDDIEDDNDAYDATQFNGEWFLDSQAVVTARWLTWRGRMGPGNIPVLTPGGKAYRIRRQAVSNESPSRTAAQTLQFPRGVGIDFDPTDGDRSLGVVFSPNGTVQTIFRDGAKEDADEPLFILLGRVENSNPPSGLPAPDDLDYERYDFRGGLDDEQLAQRRREVNLLNPDSRWVVVSPAGRVISSENASFDPRAPEFINNLSGNALQQNIQQCERQRDAAREFAAQMQTEGGG